MILPGPPQDDVLLPGRGVQSDQPGGSANMEGEESQVGGSEKKFSVKSSQEGVTRRLTQQSWTQSVLQALGGELVDGDAEKCSQSISDVTLKSFRSDKVGR